MIGWYKGWGYGGDWEWGGGWGDGVGRVSWEFWELKTLRIPQKDQLKLQVIHFP